MGTKREQGETKIKKKIENVQHEFIRKKVKIKRKFVSWDLYKYVIELSNNLEKKVQ